MKNKQDETLSWAASAAACLALAAVLIAGCQVQPPAPVEKPAVRAPAAPEAAPIPPAAERARYLAGADGVFSVEAFKGRPLLVSVQGVGTPTMQAELQALNRVHDEWSARGVAVVGLLAAVAEGEDAEALARALGTVYPIALASGDELKKLGGVRALPTHVLVDAAGEVRQLWPGALEPADLRAALERVAAAR